MTHLDQPTYSEPPEECDVEDREAFIAFRAKRLEWLALLRDDPEHSIYSQLSSLVWQDSVFRLFNEIWRTTPPDQPTALRNSLLAEALGSGYVTGMILGVGRLTDPAERKAERGVVSLRRVFEDICNHRHLLTREIFVCCNNRYYDPDTIPPPSARGGIGGGFIGIASNLFDAPKLHPRFDILSGVAPSKRSRRDLIVEAKFAEIEALLSVPSIARIRDLRNKFIAHAADAHSRQAASVGKLNFTLGQGEEALHTLCQVFQILRGDILCSFDGPIVPVAQFSVLEGLTEPAILPGQRKGLMETWHQLTKERNDWLN